MLIGKLLLSATWNLESTVNPFIVVISLYEGFPLSSRSITFNTEVSDASI